MSARSPQLWRTAWERLPGKYQALIPLNLVGGPEDLLQEVERQVQITRGAPITLPNGSTFFLRDVLEKISHWVKRFVEVGDAAVQYDPGHAALPWAALRLLLQASINNISKHSAVLEGIDTISRWLVWGKVQESFLDVPPLKGQPQLEQCFVRVYERMLTLMARSMKFLKKGKPIRMLSSFFSSDSKFRTDIDEIVKAKRDLEGHISQCSDYAVLTHTNSIQESLDELRQPVVRMERVAQLTLDAVERLLDAGRVMAEDVLDWASGISYEKHYKDTVRKALNGTGTWLFQDLTYYDWKNTSCSEILWLHGGAGFGKSTLISMIIRSLMDSHNLKQEPHPMYFYCSRNTAEPERGSAESIMRSLMRQASSLPGGPPLHSSLVSRYQKRRVAGDVSIEDATEIIIQSIADRPMTFILLDALDECSPGDRELITDSLERILKESVSLVKIFVTSRDNYIDISRFMTDYPDMQIDASRNRDDIQLYVKVKVEEAVRKKKLLATETLTDELRENIEETLSKGANGMFRWVELQLEYLYTIHVRSVFVARLGKLPPTLAKSYSDLYDLKMVELGESQASIVQSILSWLLVAQRTLKTSELRKLILAGHEDDMTNETVLSICFDLVSVDIGQDQFQFAHPSVREFLEARPQDFKISSLHDMAVSTCLDLITGGSEYELMEYAPMYWPVHAEQSNRAGDTGQARQKVRALLTPGSDDFRKWNERMLKAFDPKTWVGSTDYFIGLPRVDQVLTTDNHPFILCASFGLVDEVAELLSKENTKQLVERTSQKEWTGLELAARNNHLDIVRHLLDNGASASVPVTLHFAVEKGYIEIVRLLIERGTDVNAQGNPHTSALHAALFTAAETETVEFLIEKGANVNLNRGSYDLSPLKLAINKGNVGLAKLLLSKGAVLNSAPDAYAVGLWNAAGKGNIEMVQLLFSHSVDVNTDHGAALRVASSRGEEELVKFLLDSGVDVNIDDGAALCSASSQGQIATAKILIEYGADVNKQDGAALRAASKAHPDVVRLLLDSGADVNLQRKSRYSDLIETERSKFSKTRFEISRFEIYIPYDWEDCSLFDGSALQIACAYDQKAVLELLLERGADIKLDDGCALLIAAFVGNKSIVKLLIEHGADVNAPISAFEVASRKGREKIAELLRQHGMVQPQLEAKEQPFTRVVLSEAILNRFEARNDPEDESDPIVEPQIPDKRLSVKSTVSLTTAGTPKKSRKWNIFRRLVSR